MKCIILAAGKGTRMGELTKNCPKPMLPIKNKPKLAYSLENLPDEITEVVLVVGYLKEKIIDYFNQKYIGKKINYVIQEELNGSAGAVKLAYDFIKKQNIKQGKKEEKVLVLMGDDLYFKDDLKKMIEHKQAILVIETNQAEQFGLVGVNEDGFLKEVIERPHGHKKGLVNTGAYILSPQYFKTSLVPISATEFGLPQTLVSMYPKFKTKIVKTTKWQPIGDAQALKKANERINEFCK